MRRRADLNTLALGTLSAPSTLRRRQSSGTQSSAAASRHERRWVATNPHSTPQKATAGSPRRAAPLTPRNLAVSFGAEVLGKSDSAGAREIQQARADRAAASRVVAAERAAARAIMAAEAKATAQVDAAKAAAAVMVAEAEKAAAARVEAVEAAAAAQLQAVLKSAASRVEVAEAAATRWAEEAAEATAAVEKASTAGRKVPKAATVRSQEAAGSPYSLWWAVAAEDAAAAAEKAVTEKAAADDAAAETAARAMAAAEKAAAAERVTAAAVAATEPVAAREPHLQLEAASRPPPAHTAWWLSPSANAARGRGVSGIPLASPYSTWKVADQELTAGQQAITADDAQKAAAVLIAEVLATATSDAREGAVDDAAQCPVGSSTLDEVKENELAPFAKVLNLLGCHLV